MDYSAGILNALCVPELDPNPPFASVRFQVARFAMREAITTTYAETD